MSLVFTLEDLYHWAALSLAWINKDCLISTEVHGFLFIFSGISPATFDGKTSQITYNMTTVNGTDLVVTGITLKVRTRATSGIILYDADEKFRLSIVAGKIKFEMRSPPSVSGTSQYTGHFHINVPIHGKERSKLFLILVKTLLCKNVSVQEEHYGHYSEKIDWS